MHGQPAWVRGRLIVPMFHPAAALRQPSLKTSVERDFARLPEWIQQARNSGRQAASRQADEHQEPLTPPSSPDSTQPRAAAMLFDLDTLDEQRDVSLEDPDQSAQKGRPTQLSLF